MGVGRVGRRGRAMRAAAAAVAVGAAACGGKPQSAGPGGFTMPPAQVAVVTVSPHVVATPYEFAGQVEAFRRVEVRSRVEGVIEARPFTEGSLVRRGALLYQLDTVRYSAAYEGALATYDNATRTLARLQPLLPRHAVAQQDVDNARTAVEAAKAALDQARKDLQIRRSAPGSTGASRVRGWRSALASPGRRTS